MHQPKVSMLSLSKSLCTDVCMCVCLPLRILITSGLIWTLYNWLNNLYSSCVATVVSILSMHGLSIDACHEDQPNLYKPALYKPSIHLIVV